MTLAPKGDGTLFYFDADADDEYVVTGCVTVVKWPGIFRNEETVEACIDETELFAAASAVKQYTTMTGTRLFEYDALDIAILAAVDANTDVKAGIKFNHATPVYCVFSCNFLTFEPQAVSRSERIKYDWSLVVTSAPTYGTVAPTLEA